MKNRKQRNQDRRNPQDIPEWHAIRREAQLVRHLLGSGVTGLGKANYADKAGEYYTAFFGLSIGLERLAKLVLVANYAITQNNQMPGKEVLKRFGHKLVELLKEVENIQANCSLKLDYPRPTTQISNAIVERLDAFADARRGRYVNFSTLGDPNLGKDEPIRKWWDEVAELILAEHYYGKPVQKKVEARAKVIDSLISPITIVRFTNEKGDALQDVESGSILTGQTAIVQRYGRFYALSVVRWLSDVFSKLSERACYAHQIDAFSGVWEFFYTYRVNDNFLRTRKIWPLS